ncbi:MAG: nitrilase-related carbon-nitrogen hydrolase [Candidatus Thorarchaeota archaeon]
MRLAVGQMEPVIANIEENISKVRALLGEAENKSVDVLVLPELCNSGYVFKSMEEAKASSEEIPHGSLSLDFLDWTEKERMVVAGICERTREGLYNSAGVFADGKHIATYRKIHLFLNEKSWFLPGKDEPLTVEFKGYKFGVMICFDWIFPEIARVLTLKGSQVILHPTNLVLPYCQDAMITRSLENRIFTATANRIGTERDVSFSGQSQITNPKGQRLVSLDGSHVGIAWHDIDPADADDKMITKRNHVINDRRPDLYTNLTQDE